MLLQPITVQFSKSTLKPSVYTLRVDGSPQQLLPFAELLNMQLQVLRDVKSQCRLQGAVSL